MLDVRNVCVEFDRFRAVDGVTRSVAPTAIVGIAGAFYAHFITFISPEQFVPLVTFYVWMSIILGGVGSLRGSLAGTLMLVAFLEGSRFIRDLVPGVAEVQMASVRLAIVGLALILFVLYRPQGLFGRRAN